MAKVFRKIREKVLRRNKLKKYVLYAIGEIILIVVGILIALQINAITQDRQRAKLEKALLRQLRFELLEIYEDIWRDAARLSYGDKSHQIINAYILQDKPYVDSLCFNFYWIKIDEYVYPTTAAYSRLKEIGLDIMENDTIRIGLQSLYEGHFPRLAMDNPYTPNISGVYNDYYLQAFRPNRDLSLKFRLPVADDTVGSRIYTDVSFDFPKLDDQGKAVSMVGYVPLDFKALKKDYRYHMLMEQTKQYRDNKLERYATVKYTIKLLIDVMERELELPAE